VFRTLLRLTAADLRRRRLAAVLTALVIAVAAGTLTLALGVARLADDPWDRTFEATNGAHLLAYSRDRAALEPLARLPEVAESTRVLPSVFTSFEHDDRTVGAAVYGVPRRGPSVAKPLVTDGAWVDVGGVVLERSFARFYGLEPGDRIALATTTGRLELEVTGLTVTASQQRYPNSQPGIAFVLPESLRRIQPDEALWNHTIGLRLDDPNTAPALARRLEDVDPGLGAEDWQEMRSDAIEEGARTTGIVLSTFAVFLLLASGFVIANQVGSRVVAQLREIGVLKALGLTPAQIGAAFALQHLVLGLAAVAVGVVTGAAAAPFFLGQSAELLDAAGARSASRTS
jgi:putative ABC transport system permease protein